MLEFILEYQTWVLTYMIAGVLFYYFFAITSDFVEQHNEGLPKLKTTDHFWFCAFYVLFWPLIISMIMLSPKKEVE